MPHQWRLTELVAQRDGPALDAALVQLEGALTSLEAGRPHLAPDIPEPAFLSLLNRYEAVARLTRGLAAYAYLRFAENTQDQAALSLRGRLDRVLANAETRLLFFDLWIKGLPDEAAARLLDASGDRRYFLESLRRMQPYTLSEAEERIVTIKDANGVDGLVAIYDMVTNAFSFGLEVEGEHKTVTSDELTVYCRHPSPDVRAAAYRELYRVYAENSAVLAEIYCRRVRDWYAEMVELRGFPEAISARNLLNDLSDEAADALLQACRQNAGLFQRYFRLKARCLGLDPMRRYDVYAPIAPAVKTYDLSEAMDLILESFSGFDPILAEHAGRVLAEDHLDPDPRPGKIGGAFCYAAVPDVTPWVLTSFSGQARDVSTLAHELGHAVHAMMAGDHSVLTFDAATPLAETASVFGEMLLTERLLRQESDPLARRQLLAAAIDDAYVTVQRQAYLCLFERDAHRMIVAGEPVDALAAHYLQNLGELFGDAVDVSEEFRWEWLLIPHICNTPFYTYAYSFGQLLVLALYQRYRAEGKAFVPRYLQILADGGAGSPAAILSRAGIDIASPDFWQGGFDVIKGLVDEFEQLEA